VVQRANENLQITTSCRCLSGSTLHALRRTFASVLYALGEDPGIVMDEMGHANHPARAQGLLPVNATRRGREGAA
jgi:integrase